MAKEGWCGGGRAVRVRMVRGAAKELFLVPFLHWCDRLSRLELSAGARFGRRVPMCRWWLLVSGGHWA